MTQEDKNKFDALVKANREWSELELSKEILSSLRRILTEIYSTNAHFIYELLQNAEDQAAKRVEFVLSDGELVFRHDGKLFSFKDVESISKVACSTKSKDDTRIGKFGVGFKSVFSYTDEPEIHSGEWYFKIKDLVVPDAVAVDNQQPQTSDSYGTTFRFPLGCPTKSPKAAYDEICSGLNVLSARAILFLQHIEEISIRIGNRHILLKRSLNGNLITLSREVEGDGTASLMRFIRFVKEVEINTDEDGSSIVKKLPIGLAYLLSLKEGGADDGDMSHYSIVPSYDKNVFIYFPAEKELSNLRFCIHGAFAPTVNRDSIRTDDRDNSTLMGKLVELQKDSFEFLKRNGFLTTDFLAILPNSGDNLVGGYKKFQKMAQEVFRDLAYTPTKDSDHKPALALRQTAMGYAALNEIFSCEELSQFEDRQLKWVRNASQTNSREAVFIRDLGIPSWGIAELVFACQNKPDVATEVFGRKTNSDLIMLYDLILKYQRQELRFDFDRRPFVTKVRDIKLVRLNDGSMTAPSEGWVVYGDIPESVHDARILHQELTAARDFLDLVGIKEYDEKAILEHYINRTWDDLSNQRPIDCDDNKLYFLMVVDALAGNRTLPSNIVRFPVLSDDGNWIQINHTYVDEPYCSTCLESLRKTLAQKGIMPLGKAYAKEMNDSQKDCFRRELSRLGLVSTLQIIATPVNENPGFGAMCRQTNGNRMAATCKEDDFDIGVDIKGDAGRNQPLRIFSCMSDIVLKELANPSAAQLVWDVILNSREKELIAVYRPNRGAAEALGVAAFVQRFANVAWIPVGTEIRKPCDVEFEDLPAAWKRPPSGYDHPALSAIRFGKTKEKERRQLAVDTEVLGRYGLTIADARRIMALQGAENGNDNVPNGKKLPVRNREVSEEEKYLSIDEGVRARLAESVGACELQNDDADIADVINGKSAKVVSIPELLSMNLLIPDYQRPYKWDRENVWDFLDDIMRMVVNPHSERGCDWSALPYRMGSIILHQQQDGHYAIVDGQQRTLTFILLAIALGEECRLMSSRDFYPALSQMPESRRNLNNNLHYICEYFKTHGNNFKDDFQKALEESLQVVVVCVSEQDQAFQLFDSQNVKGRRLEPHDLLKAYHLRELEESLKSCPNCSNHANPVSRAVMEWENFKILDLSYLFDKLLYPILKWSGKERCYGFTTRDLKAFKGVPQRCLGKYGYVNRAFAAKGKYQIGSEFAPGLEFFDMVAHYQSLLGEVRKRAEKCEKVKAVLDSTCNNAYTKALFEAVLLAYFDRFGIAGLASEEVDAAIRSLCKWVFTVRLDLQYFSPKTPNKYALGVVDGSVKYTNRIAMFSAIRNAVFHTDITKLPVEMSHVSLEDQNTDARKALWKAVNEL